MAGPERVLDVGGLVLVRWSDPTLPAGLVDLVAEAERAGHAWIGAFRDEWAMRPYLADGEGLFVVLDGASPVAMAAIGANWRSGDAAAGRLKHIYVGQGARGRGLLRPLVEACLTRGDPRWQRITLHTDSAIAARVYESYGFRPTTAHGHSTHVRETGYSAAASVPGMP